MLSGSYSSRQATNSRSSSSCPCLIDMKTMLGCKHVCVQTVDAGKQVYVQTVGDCKGACVQAVNDCACICPDRVCLQALQTVYGCKSVYGQTPDGGRCRVYPLEVYMGVSLPLVHEGGGQLWHGPHGQEHDAEEGHTKDGSGSGCGLLDAREQGANDEGHDHHLDQPAVKGKSMKLRFPACKPCALLTELAKSSQMSRDIVTPWISLHLKHVLLVLDFRLAGFGRSSTTLLTRKKTRQLISG